jgi:hypothetical protein
VEKRIFSSTNALLTETSQTKLVAQAHQNLPPRVFGRDHPCCWQGLKNRLDLSKFIEI